MLKKYLQKKFFFISSLSLVYIHLLNNENGDLIKKNLEVKRKKINYLDVIISPGM